MQQRGRQWAAARQGILGGAAAALLVGGGLGFGLASGHIAPAVARATQRCPRLRRRLARRRALADLAEHVGASVVNIKVTKVEKMVGPTAMGPEGVGPESPSGKFMQKFFGGQMPQGPREQRQHGAGSGFIISKDGYIVTNTTWWRAPRR